MTSRKKVQTAGQAEQSKLFIETARELGCDDNTNDGEIMRRLASQKKPPPKQAKSKIEKPAK